MKRILSALLLAICVLVPVGFVTASPASADVTCDNLRYAVGNKGYSSLDTGLTNRKNSNYEGRVRYQNCSGNGHPFFTKVVEYSIILDQDTDGCGIVDTFRANPNVLNWWNPDRKDFICSNNGNGVRKTWIPDSDCQCVNVYPELPANERCIGAEMVAHTNAVVFADEDMPDVPSICFSN